MLKECRALVSACYPTDKDVLILKSFDSEPITIMVGAAEKKFFVHESHIRSSSEFFDITMNHDWKEKSTRTITLPEQDPEAFAIYIKWLYSGHFFIKEDDNEEEEYGHNDDGILDTEWENWSHSYKLGDFLLDEDFKDALIDMAIERMRDEVHYVDLPSSIYDYSSTGSPHRQLALDVALHAWPNLEFNMVEKRAHPLEFLTDLVRIMGTKIRIGIEKRSTYELLSPDINTCRYHEHTPKGALCYKDKCKFLF